MTSPKRTSETYQQYVQNLYKWEKKIKEQEKNLSKDESLTTSTIRPCGEILLGAVQNPPVSPEKVTTNSEEKGTNIEKPKKIKAFDYQAWDKFDVDKALEESNEEIDNKKEKVYTEAESVVIPNKDQQQIKSIPTPSTPSNNKPTSMSKQRQPDRKGKKTVRLEQALQEKETGNSFYKKGNYTEAIVHYGNAMELDPKEAVYVINRAMAYLKLQKWQDAELDCTIGLMLHPDNPKALWRRGIARKEQGKLEEAKNDLQDALRLEPNDKAVKDELDKVLKAIELATSTKTDTNQTNEVPRRRLNIEEVDFDEDDIIESKKIDTIKDSEKITKNNKPTENSIIPPKKTTPKEFRAPQSVIDFERDWSLYQSDEDLYHYIKVISPPSFPSLLSNLLEPDYLSRILIILKDFYLVNDTVNDIYDILYNLSRVERFNLVIGLLGKEDKKALEVLFKALIESSKDAQNGINNLQKLTKATRENVLGLAKTYHVQDLE